MPTEVISRKAGPAEKGFLPYDLPYITDELRKKAKTELYEDEDTRVHSLKLLRTMLDEETNLNYFDEDHFLLGFLRAKKFDVNRAFNMTKIFYNVKNKHKELFSDYDFSVVQRTLADNSVGFLPYRDAEGCVVLILHVGRWNPQVNSQGDLMRALTTGLLHASFSPSTQVAGFKVICDVKGFSLSQLPHVSPTYLWLFAEALQNCFPARFKAVHIVNEGHLFSYVWSILKSFLTKKLKDRFHFHGKNVNKLHKFFNPSILPVEYGGELPPYDNSEWAAKLAEKAEYLTYMHSFGYIKSKKNKNAN